MSSITSNKFGRLGLLEEAIEITYDDAAAVFSKVRVTGERCFLLESKDVSKIYGRLSLIGIDPVVEVKGKNEHFTIKRISPRGEKFYQYLIGELKKNVDQFEESNDLFIGKIVCERGNGFEEAIRTKKRNISLALRTFVNCFHADKKALLGLYGAFSYDMVRLFEDIPNILDPGETPDFSLSLYDTFIFFDHLKERAELILFRTVEESLKGEINIYKNLLNKKADLDSKFVISGARFDLEAEDYLKKVELARELAKRGELFEVVFSNELQADFSGDPFALYLKYRNLNPSPYLFYFELGDEQLVGASPEMMVRVEHGLVHLRPISGTAKRGRDPVEDHENMLSLLNCDKERAELDMLIDLGRNDLARICKPGIEVSDYRFVEKYSRVMHTVTHLSGKLRSDCLAIDALISCLNAGTLTGTPKVAAMIEIEKNEKSRRGFYGGAVGYLTFSGDLDTGIIIRTAHIKSGRLKFRVGATLLYYSEPLKEYEEILQKAAAFLQTFNNSINFENYV